MIKNLINGKFESQEKIDRMKKFIVNEYLSVLYDRLLIPQTGRNADSPSMLKFIGYSPYGGNLFTIPDYKGKIFGLIFNTDDIEEARLKCIKPENPCQVLSKVRARLEKENEYNKPHQLIVPLLKALSNYKTEIYKRK